MRSVLLLTILFGLIALSVANPTSPYGYFQGWRKGSRMAATEDSTYKLTIAVVNQNLDLLENLLYSVSNPKSPMYGKYLTIDELTEMTAVPKAADNIANYLKTHMNAKSITITPDLSFIRAEVPVSSLEDKFNTKLHHYQSKSDNRKIVRAESYTVPHCIQDDIAAILNLNHFPNPKLEKFVTYVDAKDLKDPNGYCVPSTLNSYYNINSNTITSAKATQGCFEDGQNISPSDVSSFQQQFHLPSQKLANIVGPNNPWACLNPDNCGEAALDIEYIMAVAQGAPTTFWAMDPNDQTPFIDWLIALSNDPNAPIVNSVSYGEVEQTVPSNVTNIFNTQIQKIGTRGISVMVSSGDDGVANFPARTDPSQCGFFPSYPASSPFVTAVGATQGPEANPPTQEIGESSSTGGLITSGGGFSTVWSQPSYQSSFVNSYLSNPNAHQPPSNLFAGSGRGYPDVSIIGHNYVVVVGGQGLVVSGTSASSPVFAGMISLINAQRFAQGKPSLGFLNPALYQLAASNPEVFHDITSGKNNCPAAQSNPTCCQYGFTAVAGWDAMTGLGSVNYQLLAQHLVAL